MSYSKLDKSSERSIPIIEEILERQLALYKKEILKNFIFKPLLSKTFLRNDSENNLLPIFKRVYETGMEEDFYVKYLTDESILSKTFAADGLKSPVILLTYLRIYLKFRCLEIEIWEETNDGLAIYQMISILISMKTLQE